MTRYTNQKTSLSTRSFRRDKIWWLFTIAILISTGAYGYYWHNNPVSSTPPSVKTSHYNPRILILAFDRIVKKNDGMHLSAKQLKSHLLSLSVYGYKPISVQALYDFYFENKKLPEKAVLLIFDYGYLDSYTLAHPVLVETNWRAAVTLTTLRQQQQDTHYLYWDRLQRMLNSGYWEILTHGNHTDRDIVINHEGKKAPFITSPMWREELMRLESAEEFYQRVTDDIKQSRRLIKDKLNIDVLGYVYRYGTPERIMKERKYLQAEQEVRKNAARLAFIDDDIGANDFSSAPSELRRLRVSPTWTSRQLIERIQTSLSFPNASETGIPVSKHWINIEGKVEIHAEQLKLTGHPRSLTWFTGSQWQDNWILEANIKLKEGDFWLIQRGALGTQWQFGGNSRGLYVKQINYDSGTHMLESSTQTIHPDGNALKLIRRGSGLWVVWNGNPLWSKPIHLPKPVNGPIAWLTWNESGTSYTEIHNFHLTPLKYVAKTIPPFPSADEIKTLISNPENIAALSPLQFTIDNGELHEHNIDTDLLDLLKYRYGWRLIPSIKLSSNPAISMSGQSILTHLIQRANSDNWGGLHFDMSNLSNTKQKELAKSLYPVNQLLNREKRQLLITQAVDQDPKRVALLANNKAIDKMMQPFMQ